MYVTMYACKGDKICPHRNNHAADRNTDGERLSNADAHVYKSGIVSGIMHVYVCG